MKFLALEPVFMKCILCALYWTRCQWSLVSKKNLDFCLNFSLFFFWFWVFMTENLTLVLESRIKLSVSNSFKKYFLKKYLNLTLYSNRIYTKKGKIWRRFTTTTSTQRKIQIPCTSCKPNCFCFVFCPLFYVYTYLFYFILFYIFILFYLF